MSAAMQLELVVLGVGAGNTHVFHGEPSSSFIIRLDGQALLMLDVGLGAVVAARQICGGNTNAGGLPQHIYVSHNHTDHAGELPVLLAVEAQAGRRKTLLAEARVMRTLQQHRLAELQSTGQPPSYFADWRACAAGQAQPLPHGLTITPLQSRHAERCCGLLVAWQGRPVLGWTADSGYDAALYSRLAAAPTVLLDARAKGSSEHAGFSQLQAAATSGIFGSARCCVYGYGCVSEAPSSATFPSLHALKPGDVLHLASSTASQQQPQPLADAGLVAAASAAAAACGSVEAAVPKGPVPGCGELGSSCSIALPAAAAGSPGGRMLGGTALLQRRPAVAAE